MKNTSPCETCTRLECVTGCRLPGCSEWRHWWIAQWDTLRRRLRQQLIPAEPSGKPARLEWDESGPGWVCPVCGHFCDDPYYLDKFCPGCGTRLHFSSDL